MFKFMGFVWRVGGKLDRKRLNVRRLEAILPNLDLLDDSTVHSLWTADGCRMATSPSDSRLSDVWQPRSGVDEPDLWQDLDRIAEHNGPAGGWTRKSSTLARDCVVGPWLRVGVAGWTGLEPAASGVTGRRPIRLSYW
jgi:hypothetical protein